MVKQTDLGPAPWTGKKIDFTYSALNKFGYNEGNFPTGATAEAQYLGHNPSRQQLAQAAADGRTIAIPGTPGQNINVPAIPGVAGTRATAQLNFNAEGFRKAKEEAEVNKLITGMPGGKEYRGLLSGGMPKIGEFLTSKQIPGLPPIPGSPGYSQTIAGTSGKTLGAPGTSGRVPQGHELHGLLPVGAHVVSWNRRDQGRDIQLHAGQVLLATGNGYVIRVGSDPAGFGPDYPIVHLTSGPEAGKDVYYGHTDALVKPGQRLMAGQPVAKTSRTGHNAPPGWLEYGYAPGGTPGPFGQETPF